MPALPKPDLSQLVDAIRELTALACDDMIPIVGRPSYDLEAVVRRIVTRSLERGVELQRSAIILELDRLTPLVPPPLHRAGKGGTKK